MPVGEVSIFAGSAAPTGWLLCNGASLLRASYPALFAVIGVVYGAADGTHFNVPNLKGRVVVGVDAAQTEFDALAEVGGTKTHLLIAAEMPSHGHVQNQHNHTQDSHGHTQNAHGHTVRTDDNLYIIGESAAYAAGGTEAMRRNAGADIAAATNTTATNQTTVAGNQGATATNQNTGGGGAHQNLQPYMALHYIIQATMGGGPSVPEVELWY